MDTPRFEREPAGSFFRAAKERVDDYFRTTGKSRQAGPLLAAKAVLLVALIAGSYAAILLQVWGPWSLLPLGLVFGFASLLLAINVGHDASHQVVARGPALNNAIQRLAFVLVGVDGYLWRLRHIKSHHLFPNVNGSDTDIDENPFVPGGSNAHASHHLFPRVCHTHYPAIARIIEATAAEYGVRYNAVSLWGMVRSHFRLLYQLGRRPEPPRAEPPPPNPVP